MGFRHGLRGTSKYKVTVIINRYIIDRQSRTHRTKHNANNHEISKSRTLIPVLRGVSCPARPSAPRSAPSSLSPIDSAVPRRSWFSISSAADASWSPCSSWRGCIAGDVLADATDAGQARYSDPEGCSEPSSALDGPKTGLGRVPAKSTAPGIWLRGLNAGDVVVVVSAACPSGARFGDTDADPGADPEYVLSAAPGAPFSMSDVGDGGAGGGGGRIPAEPGPFMSWMHCSR